MYICKECFLDDELRSEINANAVNNGVCEVLGIEERLMDFSEFHGFFIELLSLFSPTNDGDKTIVDFIQDEWHLFKDKNVAVILLEDVITKNNCCYSISSFVDYKAGIKNRIDVWNRLKKSIRRESRFFTDMDEFARYNYLTAGKSLHKDKSSIVLVLHQMVKRKSNVIRWDALQTN